MDEELIRLAGECLKRNYPDLKNENPEQLTEYLENMEIDKVSEDGIGATFTFSEKSADTEISLCDGELNIICDCDDFQNKEQCIHVGLLLQKICQGDIDMFLPEREKEEPELMENHEIVEVARENPELFVNCLAAGKSCFLANVAMVIKDREHLYRELEYLESVIHSATYARKTPSSGRMHFIYDLALCLSEMVPQFDDIDYERLIYLQSAMIQAARYYEDRCLRHGDPFHMNIQRMFYHVCQSIPKAPPEKRYNLINRWLHMADEDMLPFMLSDIMSALSDIDKVRLGKRLAELNMKKAAKFFGWKKKSRKR